MQKHKYLIIGGGTTAAYAAQAFVEGGVASGQLAILSADADLPCDRPPLSKGVLSGGKEPEDSFTHPHGYYDDHGISLHLNTIVGAVHPEEKTVDAGEAGTFGYEKLLLATGAKVNRLDAEGAAGAPIYYLRSVEDARRIREAAATAESVLVLGGGFIGLEAAASLRQRGLDVTLAYPEERVLHHLPGTAIDRFYRGYYESKGIALHPGVVVERFAQAGGKATAQTGGGDSLSADFVVAGIGVSPCVQLGEKAGLYVSGGINTDEYLATSDPNIFAAGDAAAVRSPETGDRLRVEHWQTAHDHGQVAAANMMGAKKPYLDSPYFFSDTFDASWEVWGRPQCAEEAVVIGKPEEGSFSVWWTRHGIVQAAFVLDRPGDEREAARQAVKERGTVPEDLLCRAEIEEVAC